MCEFEKITGSKCNEEGTLSLSYNDTTYSLCKRHFHIVLPYSDTKDNDGQSEMEYQKQRLVDILKLWSSPYMGDAKDHWKMLVDKIDQLVEEAYDEGISKGIDSYVQEENYR